MVQVKQYDDALGLVSCQYLNSADPNDRKTHSNLALVWYDPADETQEVYYAKLPAKYSKYAAYEDTVPIGQFSQGIAQMRKEKNGKFSFPRHLKAALKQKKPVE